MMTIIVEHKSNLVLDVDNTIQVSTNNHTKWRATIENARINEESYSRHGLD
jgi:hypothetical protein